MERRIERGEEGVDVPGRRREMTKTLVGKGGGAVGRKLSVDG